MCIVSDKIKFCTCVDEEVEIESLDNYWILYRYNPDKFERIVGMFILPREDPSFFELNKESILKRLKESDAFDIPIVFKSRDRLLVSINNDNENIEEDMTYLFKFTRGKWKSIVYEPFHLMEEFDQFKKGSFEDLWEKK